MSRIKFLYINKIILILFLVLGCQNNQEDNSNKVALKEIQDNFIILENYLANKSSDSTLRRIKAVYFFEQLTGVISESDGNDLGKLNPTKNDYFKWKNWFDENKEKIFFDKKEQRVKLKTN